jgi:hypothetical protein
VNGIELAGTACWLLLVAAFFLLRRAATFSLAAIALTGAFLVRCATADAPGLARSVAMTIGLIGMWLGLLLVRAMLGRSVSLGMLGALAAGRNAGFADAVAGRLDDAATLGLIVSDGKRWALTPRGRAVAAAADLAYRVTRARP